MGHTRHRTDRYRSSPRRNYSNRHSPRPASGRFWRPRHRSNSPRRSPSRSPAVSRPWHNNGRNFTAPNESYHQYSASRYGHHQYAEGTSPGTLGEITNQSPLPSPGFRLGPSRPPKEDDEDSLFVGDGPSTEYPEDYAEPDPDPLPRPLPKTRPTENQDERSEFPEAYRRRPEPLADSKIASGMYFPAIGKPILKPLPAKPHAAQSGENVLKPRYISTTGIPIEASTTQQESASKKPVTGPLSKRSVSFKPTSPKTDTPMKAPALSKAFALSKAVAPSAPGNGLPLKPPALRVRFLADDSPEPSVPRPPSTSTNLATSGDDRSATQEPQQSVHTQSLKKSDLQLPDKPKPEKKPDFKPVPAPNRSIRNRRAGDPFSPEDLKIIWNNCFGQRQIPDASRLDHFALPIPSHSYHLVSPAQLERATRYVLSNIVRFDVLPLQLGGEKSPLPDEAAVKLLCLDPVQSKGHNTTPAYHKLQLRPSTTIVDGLAWNVLRSMQVAWELTARWYKEVIVDGGWNTLGRIARRDLVSMHPDGDAMDIDGEENHKNNKHDDIKNPATNTGLGDFAAAELRRNVMKTKLGRDKSRGSTDIDLEIGRWMDQIGRELN